MVERIELVRSLPDAAVEFLKKRHPDRRHYDENRVIGDRDVDVFAEGRLLLSYRKDAVSHDLLRLALKPLTLMAKPTNKRPTAAGANRVFRNNVGGSLDGKPTAFNRHHPADWWAVQPLLREMNEVFRNARPAEYAVNERAAGTTPSGLIIPDTSFTTVTANLCDTGVHQDSGNLKGGYGLLTAIRSTGFMGGLLVFLAFGIAVDIRPGGALIADNRQYHGNTRFLSGRRVSCVAYFNASNLPPGRPLR